MTSTYNNTVLDFDLGFLDQPPPTNAETYFKGKCARMRKAIIFLKKRVKVIDHYVSSAKSEKNEVTELRIANEKLKNQGNQYVVEIGNFIQQVTRLENELAASEAQGRQKDETISELRNQNEATQRLYTQYKVLVEEHKLEPSRNKKGKGGVINNVKNTLIEKEVGTLRKNNAKLEKVNEKLRKENAKIPDLEKEIENLRKENAKIPDLEKEIENLQKENAEIPDLEKEIENLQKENAEIPDLEKEIENLRKNNTSLPKSEKVNNHNDIARIEQLEQEIATLCKENAEISKLENEIELLQKENAKIPELENKIGVLHIENAKISELENKIEVLHIENAKISELENKIEVLHIENAKISELKNEIEVLHKESAEIPKLEREIVNLQKENTKIANLEKEIEYLQKENAKIPKLLTEIENLLKENVTFTKLNSEKETLSKSNIKILNLEKDNEILNTKNTEIETENEALSNKIVNIPNKGEDQLISLTATTRENGKLRSKHNKRTRKYKSLPDRPGERSDDSEAENDVFENAVLSPIRNDTIGKKSQIGGKNIAVPRELFDTENSSEYLVNYSPSNGENIDNEELPKDSTMSESLILFKEIETPTIIIIDHNENQNICDLKSVSHRKSHSNHDEREVSNSVDTSDKLRSKKRTQEKECLEINNSLRCESHTELELENIFSAMKLNYNAISPIPTTPINVDSTSSPSEKFDKCCSLCYKTIDFMQTLIKMTVSQGRDRNKAVINDCDKMIACFEAILKSEQILTETNDEHSVLNTDSNMEISDFVLGRDDNNLDTISTPESSTIYSQKETQSQNKKCEKTLSQNASLLPEENQDQLFCNYEKLITISNSSSPDKCTNMNRDKQVEKGLLQCLPMSMDGNQLINHSVSEELATDNGMSKVTDSDGSLQDIAEVNQPPIIKKKRKYKKKTKLEKLKKKLEPKYKIRMEMTKPENMRVKPKQILHNKRKVTENDTSASLNRKDIYEKAVKFMAQLNSQQSAKQAKIPEHTKDIHKPQRHISCPEKNIESSDDDQVLLNCSISTRSKRKISELFDCSVPLIKDQLLLSPRKSENSTPSKGQEDNNSSTPKSKDDYNPTIHRAKEGNNINKSSTHKVIEDIESSNELPLSTRLRCSFDKPLNIFSMHSKGNSNSTTDKAKEDKNSTTPRAKHDNISTTRKVIEDTEPADELPLRARLRRSFDKSLNVFSINAKKNYNSSTDKAKEDKNCTTHKVIEDTKLPNELPLRKRLRRSSDKALNVFLTNAKENGNSATDKAKEDKNSTTNRVIKDTEPSNELPLRRSLRRSSDKPLNVFSKNAKESGNSTTDKAKEDKNSTTNKVIEETESSNELPLRKRLRRSSDKPLSVFSMNAKENGNSTNEKAKEDKNSTTRRAKHDSISTTQKVIETAEPTDEIPLRKRLRRSSDKPLNVFLMNAKVNCNSTTNITKTDKDSATHKAKENIISTAHKVIEDIELSNELPLGERLRRSSNEPVIQYKRVLRSATVNTKLCTEDNNALSKSKGKSSRKSKKDLKKKQNGAQINNERTLNNSNVVGYEDLDLFSGDIQLENKMSEMLRRSSDKPLNVFSMNNDSTTDRAKEDNISTTHKVKEAIKPSNELPLEKGRRRSSNEPIIQNKRVLRSSTANTKLCTEDIEVTKTKGKSTRKSIKALRNNESGTQINDKSTLHNSNVVGYKDLDVFSEDIQLENQMSERLRSSSDKSHIIFSLNANEENNCTTDITKEDNMSTTHEAEEDIKPTNELPLEKRRRRSSNEQHKGVIRSGTVLTKLCKEDTIELSKSKGKNSGKSEMVPSENDSATQINNDSTLHNGNVVSYEDMGLFSEDIQLEKKMSETLRPFSDTPLDIFSLNANKETNSTTDITKEDNMSTTHEAGEDIKPSNVLSLQNRTTIKSTLHNGNVVSDEDLNVLPKDKQLESSMWAPVIEEDEVVSNYNPKDSILCNMIKKYGVETVTRNENKVPGKVVTKICEKIERDIKIIIQNHCNKKAKDNLVGDLRKLNYKHFIAGLMQFLGKPERKIELFGKVKGYPAPAMTKTEQILLDIIAQLKNYWTSVDVVDAVLCSIEFTLFKLNRTPEFDVIESISHFYAVLCRFVKAQSRLRLFILDAMYCIQFKSVPLIQQCLEVWMSLIPLSHMGMAKTPMVTCLVYLLHFYKCDDRFNRVQGLRNVLRNQYFYKITNWSETKILEMFKSSITGLRDISIENKMLRLALIILAKRRGPQWCQLHIVKNLLQPMIVKKNVPNNVKLFCVSVIGPLMKPYPPDMKVHCEIAINQLLDVLDNNPTPEMEEAVITSMMAINRHDQRSLNRLLLSRKMRPMSVTLEKTIRDYVKAKPLKVWEMHLPTIALELENYYCYN